MSLNPIHHGAGKHELTVLITCYRRRRYLVEAVHSALDQTLSRSRYEVVVVKDWADEDIDRDLTEAGTRVHTHDYPSTGMALVAGLANSTGDLVSFLDDDDLFLPRKLETVLSVMLSDPEIVLLRDRAEMVDEAGSPLPDPNAAKEAAFPGGYVSPKISSIWRSRVGIHLSSITVRRTSISPYIGAMQATTASTDSTILWAALRSGGRLYSSPAVLGKHRLHTASTASSPGDNPKTAHTMALLASISLRDGDRGPAYRFARSVARFYSPRALARLVDGLECLSYSRTKRAVAYGLRWVR